MAKNAVKVAKQHTDITEQLYKKHKTVITENRLDIQTMSYNAYHGYDKRPLGHMENIANITYQIKAYEGNVPYEYSFDALPKLRERMAKEANEVHILYMSLLESLKHVEVSEMLTQVLRILQSFKAVGLFSSALEDIKINVNGTDTNLRSAIYNILDLTGLYTAHRNLYELQYIEQKIAEIVQLERKGEQIIYKKYREWYETHKFESNRWRELADYELGSHNAFPFMFKNVRNHRIKENQVFVLNKTQKIKVLSIGQCQELISEAYNIKDEKVLYEENLYWSTDTDLLLIQHQGEVNNEMLQIVAHYELRDILEKYGVAGRYARLGI